MVHKIASEAGADQRTPSIPQYFSWLNNTNEGSTEEQTLINLDFFEWMKKTYGMEIKIYAWDAGNFDGAGMGYGDAEGEKFCRQYPNGYAPIVEKAAASGIRMGLWGSPDGFGETPEEEKKRFDFMVDLCRKYHFALFKVDGVCGTLRPEKAGIYAEMLRECRKYSPDLIVLNHRLNLFEAEKYVTTFLWQGAETYVDVHSGNHRTSMHHRGFIFDRGLPDDLERLCEDHGVCISSSVAYFEDDLIYQAFGRSMILAPEIYGNPWLMRDDEFPKLARIYNLHKKSAPILVNGLILPQEYGPGTVSRGTPIHRFLTTGNNTWTKREITVSLDCETGLDVHGEKIALIQRHPTEKLIGLYEAGDKVSVTLMPHRAHLFELAALSEAYPVLENCEYSVQIENEDGTPMAINLIYAEPGEITLLSGGKRSFFAETDEHDDHREFAPVYLGTMTDDSAMLSRGEELYEAAQFGINNDSLEMRELRRSGETKIPQVKAARDAFFAQETYKARGCDGAFAFDGNPDTYFDGFSKTYSGGLRIDGGCLRVDFGDIFDADTVEIICFDTNEVIPEVQAQTYTESGTFSADLRAWHTSGKVKKSIIAPDYTAISEKFSIHNIVTVQGKLVKAEYAVDCPIRYFRLPEPMDRIHSIHLMKNGEAIALTSPKANNLQAMYGKKTVCAVKSSKITLPQVKDGDYISAALEGIHGEEGAYCVAELEGKMIPFPDRATAFRSNVWEHFVTARDRNYTYYLPLTGDMSGKELTVYTMFCDENKTDVICDLWLCPRH